MTLLARKSLATAAAALRELWNARSFAAAAAATNLLELAPKWLVERAFARTHTHTHTQSTSCGLWAPPFTSVRVRTLTVGAGSSSNGAIVKLQKLCAVNCEI